MNEQEPMWLDEKQAARRIGMSTRWLQLRRSDGDLPGQTPSPPFSKFGRSVKYSRKKLDAWAEAQQVQRG